MPSKQSALKTPQETPVNSSDDSIEAGIAREEKNPNYIDGGCVTPISDSVAVTYKHGHHKYLEIYDEKNDTERSLVCIRQVEDPDVKHDMKVLLHINENWSRLFPQPIQVVYISKKEDFILLRSLNDEPVFTTYTPIGFPRESQLFMITGLSHSTPKNGHHITWRRGILCSEKLDYKRRLLGTALIGDRDSGAPCYKSPCSLIGIMSSTKTTAPHLEDKQAKYLFRLIENAINDASCHPSECTIVPATYISSALQVNNLS
jgi:hypothetical protein